jgi:hypothetical protein
MANTQAELIRSCDNIDSVDLTYKDTFEYSELQDLTHFILDKGREDTTADMYKDYMIVTLSNCSIKFFAK